MADIVNQAKSVASTFSSWDSCMSKTYCKWPVIAAIIIACLIVFSILWCIFSCLCCGITLCNACVKCITCCGCCGACGDRGGSRSRHKDAEYQPMPPTSYQGYQPQPSPMMYNSAGPQFATFDTRSKQDVKVNEDSLPAMPSWSNATTRQVEDHSQRQGHAMEMGRMQPQSQQTRGAYSQLQPSSPIREDYHQSQSYASDLGAQRLDQRQHQSYNDFQDTPLSPAPTYYSTVPAAGTYRSTPQHTVSPPLQNHYNSTAPYPSSRESTLFESESNNHSYAPRSISPPSAPSYSPFESYQSPQQVSQGARPPSLLTVGRKPVPNSYREV